MENESVNTDGIISELKEINNSLDRIIEEKENGREERTHTC